MFLYALMMAVYIFICFALMAVILIQKSKGSIGIGNLGGSMQMLFGGSGGQTLFQKVTWILGALLMILSLVLALLKTQEAMHYGEEYASRHNMPAQTVPQQRPTQPPQPVAPIPAPVSSEKPVEAPLKQ